MALDLFAVFFGGATALLPVFATTILHAGAIGFGFLRAASGAGAFVAALLAARLLPQRRAGLALHGVIAGFGVSMVAFGLSRSLPLSLAALFVAGLCDGTSVVIRRAILRLASPEALRGRIAAVNRCSSARRTRSALSRAGSRRACWARRPRSGPAGWSRSRSSPSPPGVRQAAPARSGGACGGRSGVGDGPAKRRAPPSPVPG